MKKLVTKKLVTSYLTKKIFPCQGMNRYGFIYLHIHNIAMENFKVSAIYPFSGYVPKTDFCDNESTFLNKSAVTSPTDSSRDKLLAPKLRSKHSQSSEVKNHKGF